MKKHHAKEISDKRSQDKKRHGFSIVEIAVVVVVIGILAGIVGIISVGVQRDARDHNRKASATAIAESLEKYYQDNGEYPSVTSIADKPISNVRSTLGIPSGDILLFPQATDKTNAAITSGVASTTKVKYQGTACTSTPCSDFTLSYVEEGTGNTVTIKSRAIVGGDQIDNSSLPQASRPTVSGSLADDNITVTVKAYGATCSTGEPKYKIRYATSTAALASASWSSDWLRNPAATTFVGSGAIPSGTTYYFEAIARCFLGSASGADSQDSVDGSILVPAPPLPTPGDPAIAQSTSGATTTWSWSSSGSCSPYTKYYRIRVINSAVQNVAWTEGVTATSYAATTNTEGVWYEMRVQAYCQNGASRAYSAEMTNRYTRPISSTVEATSGQVIVVKNGKTDMQLQLQATGSSSYCASGLTPYLWYQISNTLYAGSGPGAGDGGNNEIFGGYNGPYYFYPPGGAFVLNVGSVGAGGAGYVRKYEVATAMACYRGDSYVWGPSTRMDRYGNAWVITARNVDAGKSGSWQRACQGHNRLGAWNPSSQRPDMPDQLGRWKTALADGDGWCTNWGPGAPI
ncbi:MAG TPA: prepilin-type N-terminal cleavage/methylation domain-containing protein [Candidatus Saccharimonadales bacterium]